MKEEKKNDINKIKSKFNIVVPFLFAAFNHSSYQPSQSFFFSPYTHLYVINTHGEKVSLLVKPSTSECVTYLNLDAKYVHRKLLALTTIMQSASLNKLYTYILFIYVQNIYLYMWI